MVAEIGGVPYLLPLVQRDKVYDLRDTAKQTGFDNVFIVGAGAGPFPHAGTNCEVAILNYKYPFFGEVKRVNAAILIYKILLVTLTNYP